MTHLATNWSLGPHLPFDPRKLVAAAAAASLLQVNFASPQEEILQKILESNGVYGPPPKQPVHNGRLRAGLRSLCKYNYDCKDYGVESRAYR
jgi:hypothetical protein